MKSFELAWRLEDPWGRLAAIRLPGDSEAVPQEVLGRLEAPEADYVVGLRGFRPAQFAGGRLALREAASDLGLRLPAVLADDRGAPLLPQGFRGSISHKRELAVALVGKDVGWTIGLDYEERRPARSNIARLVLREEEMAAWAGQIPWDELIILFSLKEALYKALDPFVRRYVGFREVAVWPQKDGSAEVELFLGDHEGAFEVQARYREDEESILSIVRVRRAESL